MDKFVSGARSRSGSRTRPESPSSQPHASNMAAAVPACSTSRREGRSHLSRGVEERSMDTLPVPLLTPPPRIARSQGERAIETPGSDEHIARDTSTGSVNPYPSATRPLIKEPPLQIGDEAEQRIAQAVAALLTPTISAAVDKAISAAMALIHGKLTEQAQRLEEAEQRIASLEDDQDRSASLLDKVFLSQQALHDKVEDLENRSRRNNLRIIGLPESYKFPTLVDLGTTSLPEALNVHRRCIVERAHRIGAPSSDRPNPRAVIVKYLNYADRTDILHAFRKAGSLILEGHKLLLFADYSPEVSKRRKEFSSVCSQLYRGNIKFTLAYPAVLRIQSPSGEQLNFHCPDKASDFIRTLSLPAAPRASYADKAKQDPRDQRSPRKDPPKRMKSNLPAIPRDFR